MERRTVLKAGIALALSPVNTLIGYAQHPLEELLRPAGQPTDLKLLEKRPNDYECNEYLEKHRDRMYFKVMSEIGPITNAKHDIKNIEVFFQPCDNPAYMMFVDQLMNFASNKTGIPPMDIKMPIDTPELKPGLAVLVDTIYKKFDVDYTFTIDDQYEHDEDVQYRFRSNEIGSVHIRVYERRVTRHGWSAIAARANSLYHILQSPVEEMLHHGLGEYTDEAIMQDYMPSKAGQQIRDWIAVEEALVGGIVHSIIPTFAESKIRPLSSRELSAERNSFQNNPLYKYRNRGINIVSRMGIDKVIDIYKEDPRKFRRFLTSS